MAAIAENQGLQRARPPAALTAVALDSLEQVRADEWDALLAEGSGPLRHGYLRAWENAELRGLCSRPVVAYATGSKRPIAACPGYLYDLDLPTVSSPKTSGAFSVLRRLWPDLLFVRTYELGSPTPLTNPFLVSDESLRSEAVRALIEAGLQEGSRAGAEFLLVQNFASRRAPAAQLLAGLGFACVPMPPTGVVDLPYDSFDDYLGAMRAQYRRRARQMFKRSSALTAHHLNDFGELADELARLWRLIYDRAGELKREILTPAFFRAASKVQETSVLVLRRPDGSIASFALLYSDRPWLSFLQCGFAEEAGRREGAYFRLLYEIVRLGIEGGFEQVELGITTINPKLDVGAVPVTLYAWVKHKNPVFQRLILAMGKKGPMRPHEVEARRVFKEPPASAEELVTRRGIGGVVASSQSGSMRPGRG